MKASHILLISLLTCSLLIGGVQADVTNWNYTTPGTFTWTCPVNVTHVIFIIGGAGGGGKGSDNTYKYGFGGDAGQNAFVPSTSVSPGGNYTIVVGTGGAANAVNEGAAHAGTLSSAFGITKNGGAGGAAGGSSNHNGGNGGAGFLTGGNAEDGTTGSCTSYVGGTKGSGYSAGGGGGCGQWLSPDGGQGAGGKGSDGIVAIYSAGSYGGNAPDFSATPLTGIGGTLVHFTDLSTIVDAEGLTYNWSFGDGTYSTEIGDPQHVYQYIGSYDVSLTITSTGGSVTTEKEAYINLVNEQTELNLLGTPREVTFHIKEGWGTALQDTNVTIQGITTSTGSWDSIAILLGIKLDEAPINGTFMSQTTDTYGNAIFLMIPTGKYNVTFTKSGYTFSPPSPMILVPDKEDYEIWGVNATTDSGFFEHGSNELQSVNISVVQNDVSAGITWLNLTYLDTTGHTTGGYIDVIQKNDTPWGAPTTLVRWPVPSSSFTNSTVITHSGEISGQAVSNITHTDFGRIKRSFPFSAEGAPVSLLGFSSGVTLLIAFGTMALTLLGGGALTGRKSIVVVCFEGWIFLGIGFFNYMITAGMTTHIILVSVLSFMTVMAILGNIEIRKKKEKY